MNFDNASFLSYQHSNIFLGDFSFRYKSLVSMSLKGYVLDLSNTYGVDSILAGATALSSSLKNAQEIIINNKNYGRGRIMSVSFSDGNWVRTTEYTVSIEIEKETSFLEILKAEKEFENVFGAFIDPNFKFVEDFSENYILEYSADGDLVSGSQSFNIKLSNLFQGDKISCAKIFADVFLKKTSPASVAEKTGDYNLIADQSLVKNFYTESYDSITGQCSFSRNFTFSNNNKCYSVDRTISVSINDNGSCNVRENGKIKGLCDDVYSSAKAGLSQEMSDSFSRCSAAFANYRTILNLTSADALINKEVEKSTNFNKFSGEVEYSLTYTNDNNIRGDYSYEHSIEMDRDEIGTWSVSENGKFTGLIGSVGSAEKFNAAKTGLNSNINAIFPRMQSFYTYYAKNRNPSSSLKEINKKITVSQYEGYLSYSYESTDDDTINMTSAIRKKSIAVKDSSAVISHNDFIIPGGASKYTIAQTIAQTKQASRNISVDFEIANLTPSSLFIGKNYLSQIKDELFSKKGSGKDIYLESCDFSFDEIEQTVSASATYKHSSNPKTTI